MKYNCEFTSIPLQVPQFSKFSIYSSKLAHPIFYLDYKELYKLHSKFLAQKLGTEETILLLTAFLHKSGLVQFASKVDIPATAKICIEKDRKLYSGIKAALYSMPAICEYTLTTSEYNLSLFPKVYISTELALDLYSQVGNFIDLWQGTIHSIHADYLDQRKEKVRRTQENLIALAINSGKTASSYIDFLVRWLTNELDLCEEYIELLLSCANCDSDSALGIDYRELEALQSYLYNNLDNNSLYSEAVFSLVRTVINIQKTSLGIGADFEIIDFGAADWEEGEKPKTKTVTLTPASIKILMAQAAEKLKDAKTSPKLHVRVQVRL